MKILSTSPLSGIDFLIREVNYRNIYAQLKQFLLPDEMALFAGIEVRGNEVVWYTEREGMEWRRYRQAQQAEKEQIADELEKKREAIREKVGKLPGLAEYAGMLLQVPSDEDIFYADRGDGTVRVVLTRWGCRGTGSGKPIDILGAVIGIPCENQAEVVLKMVYKDGNAIARETFWYSFYGVKKPFRTDEQGEYRVGKMYYEKSFSVADSEDGSGCVHTRTVVKGQEVYEMVFPGYTGYCVKVVNQNGEPCAGKTVEAGEKAYVTDGTGVFGEEQIEFVPGDVLEVFLPDHRETGTRFELHKEREENEFVFVVEEATAGQPDTPEEEKKEHPEEKEVHIRLVDLQRKPVGGIQLKVVLKKGVQLCTTDAFGCVALPYSSFTHREKIRVYFTIDDGKYENEV